MTQMNQQVPQIFRDHIGTWQGEYIKTDKTGHFLKSFIGKFTIKIEDLNYIQTNEYQYSDGKELRLDFSGKFENGILKMASDSYGVFTATAWDSGENTIMFVATKKQDDSIIKFIETISLLEPNHRVRSTQEFQNNIFSGVNLIEEYRIS